MFWLHHNNVDRFYEKYIAMHPDSHDEFQAKQAKWKRLDQHKTAAGFPEGPYGTYCAGAGAFKTPSGADYHAADSFDIGKLGYAFDVLPEPFSKDELAMKEMPVFAVFGAIEITKMEESRNVHVFVVKSDVVDAFTPPSTVAEYYACDEYAGDGSIFGLFPPGGCEACKYRPPFDLSVDITGTLRKNQVRKAEASLVVMVENAVDGELQPLAETPVPVPTIEGPMFETAEVGDVSGEGDNYAPDVEAIQRFLVAKGYKTTDAVDGEVGDVTVAAIKAFQAAAGMVVDGVAGPKTKAQVVAPQFDSEKHTADAEEAASFQRGDHVTWSVIGGLPGYLKQEAASAELQAAFDAWTPACGVTFKQAEEGGAVSITFGEQGDGSGVFDGPGGELAKAVLPEVGAGGGLAIIFDEEEKWLLQTDPAVFGSFRLLPVAMHEVGHLLGLGHSFVSGDVLGPWYREDGVALSENDIARATAIYPDVSEQNGVH